MLYSILHVSAANMQQEDISIIFSMLIIFKAYCLRENIISDAFHKHHVLDND